MTGETALSIIIVNWKSVDFLRTCLASIDATTGDVDVEVLVIDNASFDGSAEMVRREFPNVRFVQGERNVGFARANNRAFRSSRGENILFLNPDTEVLDEAPRRLLACLASRPDAGIVGPTLLNADRSVQTSCVQAFPTILNQALDAEWLRARFPAWSLWGTRALVEKPTVPVPVDAVSGACLMIRRTVFERVGGFESSYFMYGEDIDLCYRVRQAGWTTYYEGGATIVHHGGGSSSAKPENNFAAVMTRESIRTFMRLRRGRLYAAAFRSAMGLVAAGRLLLLGAAMTCAPGRCRRGALPAAFAKWVGVLRWSLGLEGWARSARDGLTS